MQTLLTNAHYKNLSEQKQLLVSGQYISLRKKKSTIYIWLFFLGGLGAHHYYMGNIISGIIYTLFCWTFIPLCLSILEFLFAWGYVDNHNEKLINELLAGNI